MIKIVFHGPLHKAMLVVGDGCGYRLFRHNDSLSFGHEPWEAWFPRWWKRRPPKTDRATMAAIVEYVTKWVGVA